MSDLIIEQWESSHPRWGELVQIVAEERQTEWFFVQHAWQRSSHILVALKGGVICGFLRFITQVIGEDTDCEAVTLNGAILTEGKVLAFAVIERYRRQGIGRALQASAISAAAQLHCYQLRSHSSGANSANHQLKLSMGFCVHPIIRGVDKKGAYFIMPLYGMWDRPF